LSLVISGSLAKNNHQVETAVFDRLVVLEEQTEGFVSFGPINTCADYSVHIHSHPPETKLALIAHQLF
jgi:hypothetical protein